MQLSQSSPSLFFPILYLISTFCPPKPISRLDLLAQLGPFHPTPVPISRLVLLQSSRLPPCLSSAAPHPCCQEPTEGTEASVLTHELGLLLLFPGPDNLMAFSWVDILITAKALLSLFCISLGISHFRWIFQGF